MIGWLKHLFLSQRVIKERMLKMLDCVYFQDTFQLRGRYRRKHGYYLHPGRAIRALDALVEEGRVAKDRAIDSCGSVLLWRRKQTYKNGESFKAECSFTIGDGDRDLLASGDDFGAAGTRYEDTDPEDKDIGYELGCGCISIILLFFLVWIL